MTTASVKIKYTSVICLTLNFDRITYGNVAGMVKWYHKSLPSLRCGFDSRYPLHFFPIKKIVIYSKGALNYKCIAKKQKGVAVLIEFLA